MDFSSELELFLKQYIQNQMSLPYAQKQLVESIEYSLFSGGKRFRPRLIFEFQKSFTLTHGLVPWAAAIEMIHTYSLIHDDLPCMDNDDFRRGLPTNHKKFGEATALLAGDALLSDAFFVIAQNFSAPQSSMLVKCLSCAVGSAGMVLGQYHDLKSEGQKISAEELQAIHLRKTGALMGAALRGVAFVNTSDLALSDLAYELGEKVGLAFQIADDVLDAHEAKQEGRSYYNLIGEQETKNKLKTVTSEALNLLHRFPKPNDDLRTLILWNTERKK